MHLRGCGGSPVPLLKDGALPVGHGAFYAVRTLRSPMPSPEFAEVTSMAPTFLPRQEHLEAIAP
jgi:hypothetical protein